MEDRKQQIVYAVKALEDALTNHPACDFDKGEEYVRRGELRPYPMHTITPAFTKAPDWFTPVVNPPECQTLEERLLQALVGAAAPVQMLNPTSPVVYTGRGPGTLATVFGLRLHPNSAFSPIGCRTPEEILAAGMPDMETSGLLPEIFAQIKLAKEVTPDWVQIAPPDTQGPFNIAHMILGTEALTLPLLEPEMFEEIMHLITDFYIAFYARIREKIGEKRYPQNVNARCRLRECSVNLISKEMYLAHVSAHDIRIAEYFGEICVHPCSGKHVFFATLENLPNIVYHEAMPFDGGIVPSIDVDTAIKAIGDRPIRLSSSRNVPLKSARDVIHQDFLINRAHPAFYFHYTITDAKPEDKEALYALHQESIEDWMEIYRHREAF